MRHGPDALRLQLVYVRPALRPIEAKLLDLLIWSRAASSARLAAGNAAFVPKMEWLAAKLRVSARGLRKAVRRLEERTGVRFRRYVFGEALGYDEVGRPWTQRENAWRISALLGRLRSIVESARGRARRAESGSSALMSIGKIMPGVVWRAATGVRLHAANPRSVPARGGPRAFFLEMRRLGVYRNAAIRWSEVPWDVLDPSIASLRTAVRGGRLRGMSPTSYLYGAISRIGAQSLRVVRSESRCGTMW